MARSEFSKVTKRAAWDRSSGQCEAAGAFYGSPGVLRCNADLRHGVEYDHILASSNGGDASLENCAAVCKKCHAFKSAKFDTPRAAKGLRQQDKARGIKRKHQWPSRKMNARGPDNTRYIDREEIA